MGRSRGKMCGIFAFLNYNVARERRYILEVLFNGLRRLEYRGYDSSGIAIDADLRSPVAIDKGEGNDGGEEASRLPYNSAPPLVFRQEGKIESLVRSVYSGASRILLVLFADITCVSIILPIPFFRVLLSNCRWA